MEDKILALALQDRKSFERLISIPGTFEDFSDKAKIVLKEIETYYGKDLDCNNCDVDIIRNRLERTYPKHKDVFKGIIERLKEVNVSAVNFVSEVLELKRQSLRLKISAAFATGKDKEAEEFLEQWYNYKEQELKEDSKAIFIAPSVSELVERSSGEKRIKIYPLALNEVLDGGALRKHHILVYGRPDAGKSLFTLNMVYGFLKQKLKVLYIGNEDPPEDLILRLVQRLALMDKFQIRDNPEKADKEARKLGYDNFIFKELCPGSPREIRNLVKEHKPDVLVVDQVRNLLVGAQQEQRVSQLEKAAIAVRNIGKEFNCLTVSITQAGDSADGKLSLDMRDVDSSKTGIQGAVDLMIGIGVNADYEQRGQRMLTLSKNKLSLHKSPIRVMFDPVHTKVH